MNQQNQHSKQGGSSGQPHHCGACNNFHSRGDCPNVIVKNHPQQQESLEEYLMLYHDAEGGLIIFEEDYDEFYDGLKKILITTERLRILDDVLEILQYTSGRQE